MEREAQREGARDSGGHEDTMRQGQRQAGGSMRPTAASTFAPAAETMDERRGAACRTRAGREEEDDGGATERACGAKRSGEEVRQGEDDGIGSEADTQEKESMNVKSGRPKRRCTGRAVNEQKERKEREETRRRVRGGAAGRIRYVGSGAGKGRAVTLAQAIMVGRVCVVRTARMGKERTDAGRPHPDPG